jgi:hypothetical protein
MIHAAERTSTSRELPPPRSVIALEQAESAPGSSATTCFLDLTTDELERGAP